MRFPFVAGVVFAGLVIGAATVFGLNWARGGSVGNNATPNGNGVTAATQRTTTSGGAPVAASRAPGTPDFASLYDTVRPEIVAIDITGTAGRRQSQQVQGLGSGVVLDTDGHILTNNHVISGARVITITFSDGSTASGTVVVTDPADDLAIVKTDADSGKLHPATIGDSSAMKIGNVVETVGNPFGLQGSFTTGVISGLDRSLGGSRGESGQSGLLQIDAAINEGSSGGGLFNAQGELIGINSALENPDNNTFAGVGYAIPINTAKPLIQRSR